MIQNGKWNTLWRAIDLDGIRFEGESPYVADFQFIGGLEWTFFVYKSM